MKSIIITSILTLAFTHTYPQARPEYLLLGIGYQQEVRLTFLPEQWPENLSGFVIKRKEPNGPWKDLHEDMIAPYIAADKPLVNVVRHDVFHEYITRKRDRKISDGSLNTVDRKVFLESLHDENVYKSVKLFITRDFDLSVLAGFGLVDGSIIPGKTYEYGLFPILDGKVSDQPVKTLSISPETDRPVMLYKTTGNYTQSGKTVKLHWEIDREEYERSNILNGFNVHVNIPEQGVIKLNDHPIWMKTEEDKGHVYLEDKIVNDTLRRTYLLKAVTIFNTETGVHALEFAPEKTSPFPVHPPLLEATTLGENYSSGVRLSWVIAPEITGQIEHVFLEKKETLGGTWQKITENLPVTALSHDDITGMKFNTNYYYRLSIILKASGVVWSKSIYVSKKKV
ncbi:MAG: fibronectin type III domain-containing protein [Cyclobacteriaceae bacterium]|nr:fibronectin type III domain-containing protein [Cyclobacteriaceae bacterium]